MSGVSPIIVAASMFLTGGAAFAAGYLMSPPSSHAAERPIVNPDAWNVQAPKPVAQPIRTDVAKCNPWDVSDIAMEAVLEEMRQRGWRPPGSVERAVADGNAELAAMRVTTEPATPDIGMPAAGQSVIAVVSDADAERMWRDADAPYVKSVAADASQPAPPIQ